MMKQKCFIGISSLLIMVVFFVLAINLSWAQSAPSSYQPTPYSSTGSSPAPSSPMPTGSMSLPPPPSSPPSSRSSSYSQTCRDSSPSKVLKDKKKVAALMKKLKGTWQVNTVYNGSCAEGPYTISPPPSSGTYFSITFKNNKTEGFCTNYWANPIDETKPHCDPPLDFYTDGTFFAKQGRLAGFMKLNGSQLEFYEQGMGGYMKAILNKKK